MVRLLDPSHPDFVWRSLIPPESPDWYFVEAHRVDEWSVRLHLFHYHFQGYGLCPIFLVQYPIFHTRYVKTWEKTFSLSQAASSDEIAGITTVWEGMAKNWTREVKGKTKKHTCTRIAC